MKCIILHGRYSNFGQYVATCCYIADVQHHILSSSQEFPRKHHARPGNVKLPQWHYRFLLVYCSVHTQISYPDRIFFDKQRNKREEKVCKGMQVEVI